MAGGHSTNLWDLVRSVGYVFGPSEEEQAKMTLQAQLDAEQQMMANRLKFNQDFLGGIDPSLKPEQRLERLAANPNFTQYSLPNYVSGMLKNLAPPSQTEKVPSGFTLNPGGTISPYPIEGAGPSIQNYIDYSLELARRKAAIPGFGEPERLALQQQSMALQESETARRLRQDAERLALTRQAADRAEKITVPPQTRSGYIANQATLQKIDDAITAIQKNPNALGVKNYLPEAVVQRADQPGVDVRARVAEIGGQRLHDLSGAVITAAEMERLKPFIPQATDSPEAGLEKLRLMRGQVEQLNEEMRNAYSGPNIRNPLPEPTRQQLPTPKVEDSAGTGVLEIPGGPRIRINPETGRYQVWRP